MTQAEMTIERAIPLRQTEAYGRRVWYCPVCRSIWPTPLAARECAQADVEQLVAGQVREATRDDLDPFGE